ncbi:MAG: hypothetical protein WA019_01170 [Candidatus Moraniibacteriota bacterium]
MRKTKKQKKSGFIMIEAAFAIFIIGVALIVFINILALMYRAEFSKRDYVIAANLAQEGVELVRNVRDNNWKAPRKAFDLPFPAAGNYCRDYLGGSDGTALCTRKLNVTATGFYSYAAGGTATKFSRRIQIAVAGDDRTITSTVTWRPVGAAADTTIVVTDTLSAWANAN